MKKSSDTTDTYLSEGAMYGAIVGILLFVISYFMKLSTYGAVGLLICVIAGGLIGLSKKKPVKDDLMEREVEVYKELDKKYNAFFPDRSIHSFDPKKKRPVLRTGMANGEQVAGFLDIGTGTFEPVTLIKNDDDLMDFARRYGVADTKDIKRIELLSIYN